jgi:hypothetical protein
MDVSGIQPSRFARKAAFLAVVVVAAACATTPTSPHWLGKGVHVVDGYWMLAEDPCGSVAPDACGDAISSARAALGLSAEMVIRGATATPPTSWMTAEGHVVLGTYAGLSQPRFAILDLAEGTRRVVGLSCTGTMTDGTGTVVRLPSCQPSPMDRYRVGNDPGS